MQQLLGTSEEIKTSAEPFKGGHAPLRVLLVGPSRDVPGGQPIQDERLRDCLRQERSLELAFLPIDTRLPGVLRNLQRVKYLRTVLTAVLYWARLLKEARRHEVLHVSSTAFHSFVLWTTPAILIARLFGKKALLYYHSGKAPSHLQKWGRTAIPIMRLADEIAVPSDYLVDVFAGFGLRARAIYNLVEATCFRFRERRPLRPLFLSNRNFEPHYNIACVLRAFALVQQRFPEARLTLAGDGPLRGELESLARDLRLRHTEFVGHVRHEEMPALYDSADIFLNASNVDNMPLSIIEAFASGLLVVTTNAGGIPYLVADGETGLLVERDDHRGMAERAIRLLEDQELALRMARNGLDECRRYTWAAVRDKWLDIYQDVAGRRPLREMAWKASG